MATTPEPAPEPAARPVLEAVPEPPAPTSVALRRRQWGTERNSHTLPAVEPPASDAAMWLGGLAIAITIGGWLAYMVLTILHEVTKAGLSNTRFLVATATYACVMTALTFSALMYLVARQGAMHRSRQHVRVPRAELDAHFAESTDSITVLIPSYCEEPDLVRGTMLSAALQEFPDLRVVLLKIGRAS